MGPVEENARAADRDRALQAVSSWTWAAGLGGIGLTVAIALVAAGSFAGHQVSAAAPSVSNDPGLTPDNLPSQPQAAPQDSFGGSNQPPAAVSGGS